MPVITRSQSRLLSTTQAAKSQLPFSTAKTNEKIYTRTTKSATPKKAYKPPEARFSAPRTPEKLHSIQNDDGTELLQITTSLPSPDLLTDVTKALWACQRCSCLRGAFEGLVDSCVICGHTMEEHEPGFDDPWNPQCDYICKREKLVISLLERARQYGVVVIRATPQVGKTTLLQLMGYHVIREEPDLEPVYVEWKKRGKRDGLPYKQYLQQERSDWRKTNSKLRPLNPLARTVYLIDEAQGSYEEEELWVSLKNYRITRTQALFVLVCVYGAVGVSHIRDPNVESQAQRMHSLQRIELFPTTPGSLCMLFRQEEVEFMIKRFAIHHERQLEHRVVDYIHKATNGHPGMVGLLLSYLHDFSLTTGVRMPQTLSREYFHRMIVQRENSFVEFLSKWARGVWSPWCESYVDDCLKAPQYSHLRLLDIKKALREVAIQPYGLTRPQKDFDAFAFCHKWGLLHTEQAGTGGKETRFTFASPLHRRVAYRRLFPGREPDAVIKDLSLQQICVLSIARFSPGALQSRRKLQSDKSWGIPEAAFQDELYCCLNLELHYLPILSEYSHTTDGRIDFYVADRKWGIEVLQCGKSADIAEHVARFAAGGKYRMWDIMDDYIILNFCPRSALERITITDESIQSHVFHVIIEPEEMTADIYTHEKELYKSWSLSEGRQRVNAEDFYGLNDASLTMEDGSTPTEHTLMLEVEVMKRYLGRQNEEMEEKRLQMEREVERERKELRLQMERERKEMRLQMEQENNVGEMAQEQNRLAPRKDRKRKR